MRSQKIFSADELMALAIDESKKPPFTNKGAEMYGSGAIWREYGYYPKWLPLWIEAPHSTTQYLFLADKDIHTFFKNAFVYTERHKNIYDQISRSSCYHTPSPFVLYKQLWNIRQDPDCKGTVVFFGHSVKTADSLVDFDRYLEELGDLPEEMKPITICLHYLDIKNYTHERLLARGINCVTAGNAFHNDFIPRFYEIIRHHKYAAGNSWTSALLYCADLGLPVSIYGTEPTLQETAEATNKDQDTSMAKVSEWHIYLRYKHIDWFAEFYRNNFPADQVSLFNQVFLKYSRESYKNRDFVSFYRDCQLAELQKQDQLEDYEDPNLNYVVRAFKGINREISIAQAEIVDVELGISAQQSRFHISLLLYQSLMVTPLFFLTRLIIDRKEAHLLFQIYTQKILRMLKF